MRDPWLHRLLKCGPILFEPRRLILMSGAQLLADTLDLLYDVEEYPVAVSRMVEEGCPNCED